MLGRRELGLESPVYYRGLHGNSPGRAVLTVMQSFARGWAPLGAAVVLVSESRGEFGGRQVTSQIASIFV